MDIDLFHYFSVSVIPVVAIYKLKFKDRFTEGCYYFITFLLSEASMVLSYVMVISLYSLPSSEDGQTVLISDILWILPAFLLAILVTFNHMAIIYYTMTEVRR